MKEAPPPSRYIVGSSRAAARGAVGGAVPVTSRCV